MAAAKRSDTKKPASRRSLTEDDWESLLEKIDEGFCTPFLGAGAAFGTLPLGTTVAHGWAKRWKYPSADGSDLARVAQFVGATKRDGMFPKLQLRRELLEALETNGPPDYAAVDEPHGVLADLPLPVFLSTNYDSFMVEALRARDKKPVQELCKWNALPSVAGASSVFDQEPDFEPCQERPMVYHLHGQLDVPSSMVLTEDDFLDFLVAVAKDPKLLPSRVQEAIGEASLLFVGYRLADWSFRVIHRGLVLAGGSLRSLSVTVQVPKDIDAAEQRYLNRYFDHLSVRVYWGTAAEFAEELGRRWKRYKDAQ